MKAAIMQPYLFPYMGYFQLINAVDVFVIYDDVNFIKKGWVNRNRLLSEDGAHTFTVPLVKASQNRKINQISVLAEGGWQDKLLKKITYTYKKAPFFGDIFPVVRNVLLKDYKTIGELATASITGVVGYLGIGTRIVESSANYYNEDLSRADRLIDISIREGCTEYINAIGGVELYEKNYFQDKGVALSFLEPSLKVYPQYSQDFVGGLSIIDVLMFCSKESVIKMLDEYTILS